MEEIRPVHKEAIYFCSKFIVFVEGVWLVVPDPIKGVIRLGRKDMFCKEHVTLYYKSYKDNFKSYRNSTVRRVVANAALKRYGVKFKYKPVDISDITEFLGDLLTNDDKFLKLFKGSWKLWYRPLPTSIRESIEGSKEYFLIDDERWFD